MQHQYFLVVGLLQVILLGIMVVVGPTMELNFILKKLNVLYLKKMEILKILIMNGNKCIQ
uniref:Uncharacterized protein n=1 Tax=uncultured marine virus TaxID=186617 RepID=A0A0F7L9T8_9VIRU|nr:hypothetical protein [uncultured marine virus]